MYSLLPHFTALKGKHPTHNYSLGYTGAYCVATKNYTWVGLQGLRGIYLPHSIPFFPSMAFVLHLLVSKYMTKTVVESKPCELGNPHFISLPAAVLRGVVAFSKGLFIHNAQYAYM